MTLLACIVGFITLEFLYRKAKSGNKPTGALIIDSFLDIFRIMGVGPYAMGRDIGTCLIEASKSTGLSDFGNTELTTKLYETTRKVAMTKSNAQYSPVGHILTQRMIIKRMEIRARMLDYIKQHPQVNDVKFDRPPVFVIGFPRTGTTFLHELLGLHPAVRQHYTWEQVNNIFCYLERLSHATYLPSIPSLSSFFMYYHSLLYMYRSLRSQPLHQSRDKSLNKTAKTVTRTTEHSSN